MKRIAFAAIAVAALAACGPDPLGFCIDAAKARCHLQFQCCTAVERADKFGDEILSIGPYWDEGGCVQAVTQFCEAATQPLDEEIAAKRISFDSAKADKCITAGRDAADKCDPTPFLGPHDPNCDNLTKGLVKDGDACTSDNECESLGSTCVQDPPVPDPNGTVTISIEGKCKGFGDAGEPCIDNTRCNEGLRCVQDPTALAAVCQPPGGVGAGCTVDDDCGAGLHCTRDANLVLVCTAPVQEGGACTQTSDCDVGLACLQNAQFQNVCSVPGGPGAQCNSDTQCASGLLCSNFSCAPPAGPGGQCPQGTSECLPGLDCRFDTGVNASVCLAGADGDTCAGFGQRCAPGLLCRNNAVSGLDECQAPLVAGDPCDVFNSECNATLRCRPDVNLAQICQNPLAPAAACTPTGGQDPCDATHRCDVGSSTCVVRLAAGAPCSSDVECTAGLFCNVQGGSQCAALHAVNTACAATDQCAVGLTCRQNDNLSGQICRALSNGGEGCTQLADCAPGLDCRADDNGTHNICRGASAENQVCVDIADCGAGLDCRTSDAGAKICQGPSPEGGRCESTPLDCQAGLDCRFDNVTGGNTCQGKAVAGAPCSTSDDCVAGLQCIPDPVTFALTCGSLGNEGDPCVSDLNFGGGLRCHDLTPTDADPAQECTSLQIDGANCIDDTTCISGHCDTQLDQCAEVPPPQDFKICDGL